MTDGQRLGGGGEGAAAVSRLSEGDYTGSSCLGIQELVAQAFAKT